MSTKAATNKKRNPNASASGTLVAHHYFNVARRPWPSLLFILPMLIIFQVTTCRRGGMAGGNGDLVALHLLDRLVELLGTGGSYSPVLLAIFPGLLAMVILLAWHMATKDPWRFDFWVLPGMLGESLMWVVPLFVFERLLHPAALAGVTVEALTWSDKIIQSFGAGIYEELVCRLICIGALEILFIDLCKLPRSASKVFIILAAAGFFAAMHHPPLGSEAFNSVRFLFRTAAGLYLSALFITRGFGVAVGCHAFYNIIVVTIQTNGH